MIGKCINFLIEVFSEVSLTKPTPSHAYICSSVENTFKITETDAPPPHEESALQFVIYSFSPGNNNMSLKKMVSVFKGGGVA